jgi:hypothetical protein
MREIGKKWVGERLRAVRVKFPEKRVEGERGKKKKKDNKIIK